MLNTEQLASLHRVEGQEGLLSALLLEVREKLAFKIIETEAHEKLKREDLYTQVAALETIKTTLNEVIRSYKNSH